MHNLHRRLEQLEQTQQAEATGAKVIIYDASLPGDADQKAAEARKQAGRDIPVILIPQNGRD